MPDKQFVQGITLPKAGFPTLIVTPAAMAGHFVSCDAVNRELIPKAKRQMMRQQPKQTAANPGARQLHGDKAMGTWSVLSVAQRYTILNSATKLGVNFYVTFRLQYTKSPMAKFTEPPLMAWDEVIFYNDHGKKERWEFVGNMYTHKPSSPTVAVWAQRYFRAYIHAHGHACPISEAKGHSKLFDLNGLPVPGKTLGKPPPGEWPENPNVKNDIYSKYNVLVQNYLKSHGGILEIEVHDIPSIIKPVGDKAKSIERLLTFNCGVTGIGPRAQAWLYSKVDSAEPTRWINQFNNDGNPPGVKTSGLRLLPPGTPGTAVMEDKLLPSGGIW